MATSNTAMTAKIIHEGILKTIPNTRPLSIHSSSRQDDSQAHCCTASLLVVVCLGLSQLVVVVRELEVLPAAMDIHLGTKNGAGHGAALNVPAWEEARSEADVTTVIGLQRKISPHDPMALIALCPTHTPHGIAMLEALLDLSIMKLYQGPIPGRPRPQGDSQNGSPGFDAFHNAKSVGLRFSLVSKLDSPSAARSAEPTAQGLSFPYVWPHSLRSGW